MSQFGDRMGLCVLAEEITPEVIDAVLELPIRVERRRRLLPARAVVYGVLGLCLFEHGAAVRLRGVVTVVVS
ncbi:transposase domain-containing protein [Streptomyces sp. 7R007]